MKITYLKHSEINTSKWDKCVSNAFNGIIYAYSWYLDIVCEDWEALVQGDYLRVMPLTCGMKYNMLYLYQPYFAQQLGVISTLKLSPEIISDFISSIPSKYKFIEINLNTFNSFASPFFEVKENATYQLDLIKTVDCIRKKYSKNTKRNIKKAQAANLTIRRNELTSSEFLNFYRKHIVNRLNEFKEKDYNVLRRLINIFIHHHFGVVYSVYTNENNLCATAIFVTSHFKTIYFLGVSTPEGLEKQAMFFLVDDYIAKHSERNLTLDFEGSNVPGIARFYEGFGAMKCSYLSIKRNNLPWYIKLLKK